ncbi:MAG: phytanoyl-CoA dioxygenase [Gammaproteobacteria bacterium RIFCSPHIGHO2_12_FULL_42_10]|nr:MAG: phytanoyl-CoA dioxygenase [Gammaproteobacteria bacterium RIFCSPHIGHO2_12_FULL_42_10]
MISLDEFNQHMQEKGWFIFHEIVSMELVNRMLNDLQFAYQTCRKIQLSNNIPENNEGTLHHLVELGESFIDYLVFSEQLNPYLQSYFCSKYILNSFGGNINKKGISSYASMIHRDIRSYSAHIPLLLNTLVMLDDFIPNNGATYLMSGSHRTHPALPSEQEFSSVAEQAIAKAGSVLVFNSNLWHCAGKNTTDLPRRSITPMYCRPFIKQQYDYSRALGYDKVEQYSDWLKQTLGYRARVPTSLSEWYQPKEKRMYQSDQG